MKQLIICSASDAHRLQSIVQRITTETTLLLSDGKADAAILSSLATDKVTLKRDYHCDSAESREEMLQEMKDLERAYYAVASAYEASTALQVMIYSLYPRLLQVDCWKMTLEPIKLLRGVAFLRHLPEGLPFELNPGAALLRRVQAAFTA